MATTMDYINQLKQDKTNLVSQLTEKGVEANENETFTELIPKISNISGGSKITPSYISFKNCVVTQDFSKSLENIDFSNITNATDMFREIIGANVLDLSKSKFDTLENISSMFYGTGFKTIILPEINCKHLEPGSMFANNRDAEYIDFSKLSIDPKVLNFQAMFSHFGQNCENPTIIFPNINFDSTQTKEISFCYMFEYCTTIKKIDLSKWIIDNENCSINTMGMFYNCQELEELDLSGIKTSKFKFLHSAAAEFGTFKECVKLKRLDIRNLIITEATAPSTLEEVPLDCKIIVKDEETKTLLQTKLPTYTNIITPEEDI